MHFAVEALLARGVSPERIFVSMERHMDCGVGLCGHCQLGPTLICRDGPVYSLRRARALAGGAGAVSASRSRSSPSGSSPRATAASSRCSTSRTSCSRSPDAVELAEFREATSGVVEGPVRPLARRGLDHDRARCRADPGGASARRRRSSRSAPARPRAGSRPCGTSPTCASSSPPSTRRPSTSRRSRPRRRSPRTSRSTSSCTAARSTSGSCSRS